MSVRGIHTDVTDMREKIFTEVARLAYEGGDYSRLEELPYKIVPGELASFRESVFTERAIVGERLRLAIGLPNRTLAEHAPVADGVNESAITERYYEPPLINIIKFACHKCLDNKTVVTNMCQGCTAHPCEEVCPKGAIVVKQGGKSKIDPEKCINCGRCRDACPYGAIVKMERPCAKACGMHAIHSDEYGRADINYDKCVSCGMCLVNCPFGAIADKGQIFQTILAMKAGTRVYAAVAPAFIGQFGPKLTPERFREAMKELGFADVVEVAAGADLCTIQEAKDYLDKEGIEYVERTGTTTDEVQLAADALVADGVDAVFTPTDNTIMTAELSIYEKFIDAGIPQYTGADSFALNGAFVGYGVDYANLGQKTADMIADILMNDADPATTSVETFDNGTATVNTETCEALGLDFDTVKKTFEPLCTQVNEIVTAESFDDVEK